MVVKRTRPAPTPVAPPLQAGFRSYTKEESLGVKMMRRVERKDSRREPHWYMNTTSDHEALATLARKLGVSVDALHVVHRYK